MEKYPGNSHSSKEEKPKTEKIIRGRATKKPPSLLSSFFEDDVHSVGRYILDDVLIPALKKFILDAGKGGLESMLYGGTKPPNNITRENGKGYVSYNTVSSRPQTISNRKALHKFDNVILESRGDAEEVLSTLVDIVNQYGSASVSDLYELVGITSNFTDNKYGWLDLRSASVSRVAEGYQLNLPRTTAL